MKKQIFSFEYKLTLMFIILTSIVGCSAKSNLADAFFASEKYEKAALEYKKIIDKNPQDWKAYARLGECYKNTNQIELALDAYNSALKLNPSLINIKDNIKEIQLKISQKYLSEKEYNKVYNILNKILKTDPDNTNANYQIAVLYNETDRPDKAKIHFENVIKINPENKKALNELKLISGKNNEAEKYFKEGKALYNYELYFEAYEKLKKSVEKKPDYKDAKYYMHISLGKSLLKKSNEIVLWEAISQFGSAMAVYPERAEPHYLMGMAYEKKDKKDYKIPIEEYYKAVELEPDSKIAEICKKRIQQFYKNKKEMEKLEKFWRNK
ncbi:tetratricopeptide repeat protein [candidate division KSB1 bacterium]